MEHPCPENVAMAPARLRIGPIDAPSPSSSRAFRRESAHSNEASTGSHRTMTADVPGPALSDRMSMPTLSYPPAPTADDAVSPLEGAAEVQQTVTPSSETLIVLQATQLAFLFIAALYLTRPIVLPIVLAVILKLLMQSGVRRLERIYVPRALAALIVITALFISLVSLGTMLSGPAHDWVNKLPEGLPRLRDRLSFISVPIESMQHFLRDAESYVSVTKPEGTAPTPASSGISEFVFAGTASFASGLFMTIIVLFFLLMSGDLFLRRLVEVLPRFRDKRAAVTISQQIESNIGAYLKTITIMNVAVGVATSFATWATGMDNPVLWGVLACLLNYIPVIGPVVCLIVLVLAGMLQIEPFWPSLLPAAAFFLIHVIEGQFITPILVARRFTLNPVVVIVSLIFWYWMWGVPGAILAVPVLAIFKIVCDGIPSWAPIGHLIEG